tara:strand:- start:4120 stop:4407 length:288 start_codon:yes stop_codon:yes gene_type:complete
MENKTTKQSWTGERTTFVKFIMSVNDRLGLDVGDQMFVWGRVTDMVTRENGSCYEVEVVSRDNWTFDNYPTTSPDNGEKFYVHWQSIVDAKTVTL